MRIGNSFAQKNVDCICFVLKLKDLEERLEKWNISEGDVYWPIIKAYLYSAIGENEKAIDLLMKRSDHRAETADEGWTKCLSCVHRRKLRIAGEFHSSGR